MGYHRTNTPNTRTLITTIVIDVLGFLVVSYPLIHTYVSLKDDHTSFQRGFFCDDESIKYPVVKEQISNGLCFFIWGFISLVLVTTVEVLYHQVYATSFADTNKLFNTLPWVFVELYRVLGACFLGGMFTNTTTELAKYKVGRLRPYFLTLCNPTLTRSDCLDQNQFTKYVVNFTCNSNGDEDYEKEISDAQKSFFSGHSSFSFYCATFLVIFLHSRLAEKYKPEKHGRQIQKANYWARLTFRGLRILRPYIQFGIFLLAFFISLTRITDYKHHPTDVITGALIGVIYALILIVFVIKLFENPIVFHFEGENQEKFEVEEEESKRQDDQKGMEYNNSLSTQINSQTHLPLKNVMR